MSPLNGALSGQRRSVRIGLLFLAAAIAAAGLFGGLARLGLPIPTTRLADLHGPLMVCGFFGTVISLERAVALGHTWALAAPSSFAAGGVSLLAGQSSAAALFFVAGSVVLLGASAVVFVLQRALFTACMAAGAVCMLAGNVTWAWTGDVQLAVGLWIAFFVVTIAAERLELSRMLRTGMLAQAAFATLTATLMAGAVCGLSTTGGRLVLGASLIGLTCWLFWFDVARRVIGRPGPPRFFAAAMLAGYGWLAVAGVLLLTDGAITFAYDLQLHAIFLGFVLSMVMAHALIILPAITRVRLTYHPLLYGPLVLLHASVALRVLGSVLDVLLLRMTSGPLTILALAFFAGVVFWVSRKRVARPA